jgi:hypothetical protein
MRKRRLMSLKRCCCVFAMRNVRHRGINDVGGPNAIGATRALAAGLSVEQACPLQSFVTFPLLRCTPPHVNLRSDPFPSALQLRTALSSDASACVIRAASSGS